jgi:epsilon-lactone hydrolase
VRAIRTGAGSRCLVRYGDPMSEGTPTEQLLQTRAAVEAGMRTQLLADGVTLAEVDAAGVPAVRLTPAADADAEIMYLHGGGFRLGSARGWAAFNSHLAVRCRARVLSVDYRLAPEHPFPAALSDARAAYLWLLDSGVDPDRLAIGGDSAGGGIAASLLVDLQERGLPLPACAFLLSPWADLRVISESYDRCASTDQLFSRQSANDGSGLYLAGHAADDPLASPVLAPWSGQPPLLIQVSDSEVLADDAARLAEVAAAAGVAVQHEVFAQLAHVWQLGYPGDPAAVAAVDQIATFVARHTSAGPEAP